MMKEESVYKIIGWILLPITALLMLYFLGALLMMPNLLVLFFNIVVAGTLIYLIRTMIFLQKNIVPNAPAKRSMRFGIRLGAFFTIYFIFNIIFGCVTLLSNPNMVKPVIDEALSVAQARGANGLTISYAQIHQLLMAVLWIALIYALLLLLHLLMSFLFLRRYRHLFEEGH